VGEFGMVGVGDMLCMGVRLFIAPSLFDIAVVRRENGNRKKIMRGDRESTKKKKGEEEGER